MNNTLLTKLFVIFFLGTSTLAHAMYEEAEIETAESFPGKPVRYDIVRLSDEEPSGSLTIQRMDENHIILSNFKIEKGFYYKRFTEFMESE